MDRMECFDELISEHRAAVERFIRYRLPSRADADDVVQETMIAAYRHMDDLRDPERLRPWLLSIARNKLTDHFRRRARLLELPLEALDEARLTTGRCGPDYHTAVSDTLERLGDCDRQMLYLYYFRSMCQTDIARRLGIPVGTVKSRLHTARRNFRREYPRGITDSKGDDSMNPIPEYMPAYAIEPMDADPFEVACEELMGWFMVPREGERLAWATFDRPDGRCTGMTEMRATGRARVHGVDGVQVETRQCTYDGEVEHEETLIAQLTDTHCRYLASICTVDGVCRYVTFLDGEDFDGWNWGEDNCGSETYMRVRGDITRAGNVVTTADRPWLLDVVGRYRVTIAGREFDTICVIGMENPSAEVMFEQFIDREGRAVLWRRYNRDDWAIARYGGRPWSEQLPDSDRLVVNGATYVHWYDCLTERVL